MVGTHNGPTSWNPVCRVYSPFSPTHQPDGPVIGMCPVATAIFTFHMSTSVRDNLHPRSLQYPPYANWHSVQYNDGIWLRNSLPRVSRSDLLSWRRARSNHFAFNPSAWADAALSRQLGLDHGAMNKGSSAEKRVVLSMTLGRCHWMHAALRRL